MRGWDNDKDRAIADEKSGLAEWKRNNTRKVEWSGEMYFAWQIDGTSEFAEHKRLAIIADEIFRAQRDADVQAAMR